MKEYEKSVELARAMVEIGSNLGKTMRALITDMNQPLGRAVGNALEMKQSIEILRGEGPKDLTELICRLAAEMLVLADKAANPEEGYEKAKEAINSGKATGKLKEIIEIQSGDPRVLDDFSLFPSARYEEEIEATTDGYVGEINAFEVGMAAKALGAGRETMDSPLDYGAGVIIDKKVGTSVKKGETLARICYNNSDAEQAPPCEPDQARERLQQAFSITADKPESAPLVYARMTGSGELTELEIPR